MGRDYLVPFGEEMMLTSKLALRIEGAIGYAAILGVLGALLHLHIGPADLETSALVFVLGLVVPSLAVKNVLTETPAVSESAAELPETKPEAPAEKGVL